MFMTSLLTRCLKNKYVNDSTLLKNLVAVTAVQILSKSVNNCQSYGQSLGARFLWPTVYTVLYCVECDGRQFERYLCDGFPLYISHQEGLIKSVFLLL